MLEEDYKTLVLEVTQLKSSEEDWMSRLHPEYRESQRAWVNLDFGLFAAETTVRMNEVHLVALEFPGSLSEEVEVVEDNGR